MKEKIAKPGGKLPYIVIFVFTLLISCNTLLNKYALDDSLVITENNFTKQGITGLKDIFSYDSFTGFFGKQKNLVAGGRYRPLSIATFAVEYSLFGGLNPLASHLINVLLYAVTGLLLFIILLKLFPLTKGRRWYTGLPFLTVMLYIATPLHTEVVANIKGRDELLAFLMCLSSLWASLRYIETKKPVYLVLIGTAFYLGMLSKENTISFLVVIPLIIILFTNTRLKDILITLSPAIASALLFIFIRRLVLGYFISPEVPRELLNNPFLNTTDAQRMATIMFTLGNYIKLLFIPYPLTHDYYPFHIQIKNLSDPLVLLSLAVYILLIIIAVKCIKKHRIVTFGILYYLFTLFIVSNIIFPVGTFMNERFLYMPSLGFCMILAYFLTDGLQKISGKIRIGSAFLLTVSAVLLVLYSLETFARNSTWHDDFSLSSKDVLTSDNSTKCNTFAGGKYIEQAKLITDSSIRSDYFEKANKYLARAIEIYPHNSNAILLMGNLKVIYYKDYKGAITEYSKILAYDPEDKLAFNNSLLVLSNMSNSESGDYKIDTYRRLEKIHPDNSGLNYSMGVIFGRIKGQMDSAEFRLKKASELAPGDPEPLKDLGIVYGLKKEYAKSLEVLEKASSLDPADQNLLQNIAVTKMLIEKGRKKK